MRSERIDLIVYSPLFVVNQTLIKEKGSHCQSPVAHKRLLFNIQRWYKTHKPDGEKQRLKNNWRLHPCFFRRNPRRQEAIRRLRAWSNADVAQPKSSCFITSQSCLPTPLRIASMPGHHRFGSRVTRNLSSRRASNNALAPLVQGYVSPRE